MKKSPPKRINKSSTTSSGLMLIGAASALVLLISFSPDLINTFSDMLSSEPTQASLNEKSLSAGSVTILGNGGGGSGTVLTSSTSESTILTNAHVCELVKDGGQVVSDNGQRYLITSYRLSRYHDLCLVRVAFNMGITAKIAKSAPSLYSKAMIIGHPNLLPTTVTRGEFSQRKIVTVLTGFKPCSDAELEDNGNAIICIFFGGLPVIRTYESQYVTALVSPGSSGSPVYNEQGEIAGVLFAGSGNMSFGYIVPAEALLNFISVGVENAFSRVGSIDTNNEKKLTARDLFLGKMKNRSIESLIAEACSNNQIRSSSFARQLCHPMLQKDLIWRN